jgi:hypothetical protein
MQVHTHKVRSQRILNESSYGHGEQLLLTDIGYPL